MVKVNYSNEYNRYVFHAELRNHKSRRHILQMREVLIQSIVNIFHLETNYILRKPIIDIVCNPDIMEQLNILIPTFGECYNIDEFFHLDDPKLWVTLLLSCSSNIYRCWVKNKGTDITIVHMKFILKVGNMYYLDYSPKTQYECLTPNEFDKLERITDPSIVENETCPMCLEDFDPNCLVLGVGKNRMKVVRLPCKHLYHTRCIRSWITSRTSCCPYCTQSCKNKLL
jgi:hypothetical protein